MNRHGLIILRILVAVVGELVLAGILLVAFRGVGLLILGLVVAVQWWVLFIFFHYRYLRQAEVVHLLATAAAAQQPLAPALWAYLVDRPRGAAREMAIAVVLSLAYWGWSRRDNFDYKVQQLAILLEAGMPLYQALRAVPGVASRETMLAAAVGQATGQLASCLHNVSKWRLATVWLELLPRFFYPLVVLLVLLSLVTFHTIFIIPKFEKIFADFKLKLPDATDLLIGSSRYVIRYNLILLGFVLAAAMSALFYFNSTVRWHFPVLGRFYRMHVQSRVLKMLGLLLQTGQTVPEALGVLIDSGYFSGLAQRRLERVRDTVRGGASLAEQLCGEGLMPANMVPLVLTAAKAHNLPWALAELGDHQARRTVDQAHRFVMALFPLCILAMGLAVGFVVLSLFMPLLELINHLGG